MRCCPGIPLALALSVLACAGAGPASGSAAPASTASSTSSANVISRVELSAAGSVSAHEVILRLRPSFMRDRGLTSITGGAARSRSVVFVDDSEHGDIESLKNFPASRVEEVRFYTGRDATTRFGSSYGAGVIQLIMRAP